MKESMRLENTIEDEAARAALNALESNVAILDEAGRIVMTNRAWRKFARNNRRPNGGVPRNVSVGTNYLKIAERSRGPSSDEAVPAVQGIRQVLARRKTRFSLIYPCHSPRKKRWFRMTVRPLNVPGRRWAICVHEDITSIYLDIAIRTAASLQPSLCDVSHGDVSVVSETVGRGEPGYRTDVVSGSGRAKETGVLKNEGPSLEGRLELLSAREREILIATLSGKRNLDIAQDLLLSPKTVSTYRKRILQKTGLESVEKLREALDNPATPATTSKACYGMQDLDG